MQYQDNTALLVVERDGGRGALRRRILELEDELQAARRKLDSLEQELERRSRIETLFTLCAKCRKVKDDDGAWLELENYLYDHITHQITHGICPDCIEELYPDYVNNRVTNRVIDR